MPSFRTRIPGSVDSASGSSRFPLTRDRMRLGFSRPTSRPDGASPYQLAEAPPFSTSASPTERHVGVIRVNGSFHHCDVYALSSILFGRSGKPITQELSLAVSMEAAVARPPC